MHLCLAWTQERPDKADFWSALGPGFHFIKGFIRVYNSLCEQHFSYHQNLNQRQHVTFILTSELLLFSFYSAQPPQLSGTLRTIQIKTNKYNQRFVSHQRIITAPDTLPPKGKNTSVVDNKKENKRKVCMHNLCNTKIYNLFSQRIFY